jgi:hypothetical protein
MASSSLPFTTRSQSRCMKWLTKSVTSSIATPVRVGVWDHRYLKAASLLSR